MKDIESTLKSHEIRINYKEIYDSSSEGILIIQDHELVYWNPVILTYIDLNHSNNLSLDVLYKHLHPHDEELFYSLFSPEISSVRPYKPFRYRMYNLNGSLKWIQMNQLLISWENKPALLCILNDITKFMNYEHDLKLSKEKYRSVFDNIEEGLYEVDLSGNLIFVNNACCKIFGYEENELLKLNYKDIINKKYASKVFEVFYEVFQTGKSAEVEGWTIIYNNDKEIYFNASVSLIKDKSEKAIGFRGIIRDVTKHKESENRIRQSEEQYRLIVENVKDAIYKITKNGYLTFVSQAALLKTGYEKDDLLKTYYLDLIADDHKKDVKSLMDELMSQQEGYSVYSEMKIHPPNKDEIWLGQNIKVMKNPDNGEVELYIVARDITKIKKYETQLELSEKKYRELVEEKTKDIIFSLDDNCCFQTVNNNMSRLLGYSEKDIKDKHITEIFHRDSMDLDNLQSNSINELLMKVMDDGKSNIRFEASCAHRSLGESMVFNFKVDPIYKGNSVVGIIGFMYPHIDDPMRFYLRKKTVQYEIDNKIITVNNVVSRLTRDLQRFLKDYQIDQVSMALMEIIMNAIEHGNLSITFEEKSKAKDSGNYLKILKERLNLSKNINKKVTIDFTLDEQQALYTIRDEGDGFNHKEFLLKDVENLNDAQSQNGRGLFIASNIFDQMIFNETGNVVTLIKKFS